MKTKEQKIAEIIEKLLKMEAKWGGEYGITLTRDAYHACNPNQPNDWQCPAVKLVWGSEYERKIVTGFVTWTHNEDFDDASDYDWYFDADDFTPENEFDLVHDDDLDEILNSILR